MLKLYQCHIQTFPISLLKTLMGNDCLCNNILKEQMLYHYIAKILHMQ